MRGRVSRLVRRWDDLRSGGQLSFSQSGEDLLIAFVLRTLGLESPVYLDIGAHDAKFLSNTYYFYSRGCRGVCVEPNPVLCERIAAARPRDVCLNVGIAPAPERTIPFYVLDAPTLSTFDPDIARKCRDEFGHAIVKTIDVRVLPVQDLIERYMAAVPNIVSIDTEGHDLAILADWDFEQHRPEVFCIETLEYSPDRGGAKIKGVAEALSAQGYFPYADTYINTIFVDQRKWAGPTSATGSRE